MPIPEQQNKLICLAGRKGSGKSTLAREIMTQCGRLFCFNTMGEHRFIPDQFTELDQAAIYLMETPQWDSFMGAYTPEGDNLESDFEEICSLVYDYGNMMFVAEEIPMLGCSAQYMPPKLGRVARLGRHRNLDVMYTAQRIAECPRTLTQATDIFILFCTTEPADLEAIAKRCGPEVARKVPTLGEHGYLVWDVIHRKELVSVDIGSIISSNSIETT